MFLFSVAYLMVLTQLKCLTASIIDPTDHTTELITLDDFADSMPIEDSNLSDLSYFSNDQDQFFTSSDELTASTSESCPVSKKRNEKSCAAPITAPNFPNLLNVFGIRDGSEEEDSSLNPDTTSWNWDNVYDPCLERIPYVFHLCCHGPRGVPYGAGWTFIDKCVYGMYTSSS